MFQLVESYCNKDDSRQRLVVEVRTLEIGKLSLEILRTLQPAVFRG